MGMDIIAMSQETFQWLTLLGIALLIILALFARPWVR